MTRWLPARHTLVVLTLVTATAGVNGSTQAPAASDQRPRPAAVTPVAPTTLAVNGSVATPLTLSADDLKAMPRVRVEVKDEGRLVVYEGVRVSTLLERAGVRLGTDLRGDAVATYVVARATDGYRAVFSLAELDPAFTGGEITVADTIDGKPLFAYQGPWRIVAPADLRGARSLRLLDRLEVVRLAR